MEQIGIIGAGTMGSGIAQLAAANGCTVHLLDVNPAAVPSAIERITAQFDRLVKKHRMTEDEAAAAAKQLLPAQSVRDLADVGFVIEAIVEDLDAKVAALAPIRDVVRSETVFASNTSSLSITRLGAALEIPARVCGMHFFNPAPVMPLVEVIAGKHTDLQVLASAVDLAEGWGKPVVRVNDSPGFIVNRVARPYYLESLRIVDEKLATCDGVDLLMCEILGFKMGPFELMDLVGIDINYAVSCSVYEQLGKPARLKPSEIQARLVERGRLGRKSGIGFYSYQQKRPEISYRLDVEPLVLSADLRRAWDELRQAAGWQVDPESGCVMSRVLLSLMNEAALAEEQGVASAEDIDVAMRLGTNYPKGLLAWARSIGHGVIGRYLQALNDTTTDQRFTPARRFCS